MNPSANSRLHLMILSASLLFSPAWRRHRSLGFHDPSGLGNLMKQRQVHLKNEWVVREDQAVFCSLKKLRFIQIWSLITCDTSLRVRLLNDVISFNCTSILIINCGKQILQDWCQSLQEAAGTTAPDDRRASLLFFPRGDSSVGEFLDPSAFETGFRSWVGCKRRWGCFLCVTTCTYIRWTTLSFSIMWEKIKRLTSTDLNVWVSSLRLVINCGETKAARLMRCPNVVSLSDRTVVNKIAICQRQMLLLHS